MRLTPCSHHAHAMLTPLLPTSQAILGLNGLEVCGRVLACSRATIGHKGKSQLSQQLTAMSALSGHVPPALKPMAVGLSALPAAPAGQAHMAPLPTSLVGGSQFVGSQPAAPVQPGVQPPWAGRM